MKVITFQLRWNVGKAFSKQRWKYPLFSKLTYFFLSISLRLSLFPSFLAFYVHISSSLSHTLYLPPPFCLPLTFSICSSLSLSLFLCGRGSSLSCMAVLKWAANQKPQRWHKPPPSSRNPIWKPPDALTAQWRCTHTLIHTHMEANTQYTWTINPEVCVCCM